MAQTSTTIAEASTRNSRGRLVALALAGAWRRSPTAPEISAEELVEVTPLLLGSGAGALGWWRVRHSDLRSSSAALELQQAYRLCTLHAAIHEREIEQVFVLLRSAGVEPILVKGWAIARVYPEAGLRPYGDIDLCVRPEQYLTARGVLESPRGRGYWVDLHEGLVKLDDRDLDDVYARSQLVKLGEVDVRVLGPEDHLRVLCVHLLRHGAWRPLWLCDIAAAVEFRPADFDWDRCLSSNSRRADWVACSIGLAHQLLGAQVDDTPVAWRAKHLPTWLIPNVLEQWETPYPMCQAPMRYPEPMATYVRHPNGAFQALRKRWPNAIEATVSVEGPLNELPRLPFQLAHCFSRAARFLTHLPALLREQG